MHAFAISRRYQKTRAARDSIEELATVAHQQRPGSLTSEDSQQARIAWNYFASFTIADTGLAPLSDQQEALSASELGSTLIAITCADRLGLISHSQAHFRVAQVLDSIGHIQVVADGLPPLRVCPTTLRAKSPAAGDAGSSHSKHICDIMRLVAGCIIVAHHYPVHAPEISLLLAKYRLPRLLHSGHFRLPPDPLAKNSARRTSEPGLGYEQYAARAACLVSLPAQAALDPRPFLGARYHDDLLLPLDKRCDKDHHLVTTSDPFCLEAMEFGWRKDMLDIALTIFLAQKGRFTRTGEITTFSADPLDQPPGFAFHAIQAGAHPFASLSPDGRDISHLRCVSTKAAFCWHALIPVPYARKLRDAVSHLSSSEGWFAGFYISTGRPNNILSLNTNAEVLEALHYRVFGPLFPQ